MSAWLGMQAALSECSRLRRLVLCGWMDAEERRAVNGRMIEALSEALPNLAVLELQVKDYMSLQTTESGMTAGPSSQQMAYLASLDKRARLHFDQELIGSIVESEEPGMQLLQIECGLGQDQRDCTCLPPMLRYLSSPCRSEDAHPCLQWVLTGKVLAAIIPDVSYWFPLLGALRLFSI